MFGLHGGDLHRTLGAPSPERRHTADAMRLPIDVARVVLDGETDCFVAHLVAGRGPWFRCRTVMVMNAAFVGEANLGPRAHPGDGLLDVIDGRLGWLDRRAARRRFGSGTHVPHPDLSQARVATWSTTFDRPVPVRLDGELVGSFRRIHAELVPDAVVVVA
jgi:diacylglycerol kinase family enzyme